MSVFKKFNGKRITSKHPAYSKARWWVYRRVKGHKTIHQVIPEARTREEAELAERQLVKQMFDKSYGFTDTTLTFGDFVESTYRKYVEQNNVNKGAKNLYIKLLLKHLKNQSLHAITPQDCRNCRDKLQYGKNQRKKESSISASSVNRIMSTLSKIFSLACEEGVLDRNPMQYVKALPEPPPRKRLLTKEQKEALWKELESDELLYRLVQLAVNMPLRRGQLLALDESVIDFEKPARLGHCLKRKAPKICTDQQHCCLDLAGDDSRQTTTVSNHRFPQALASIVDQSQDQQNRWYPGRKLPFPRSEDLLRQRTYKEEYKSSGRAEPICSFGYEHYKHLRRNRRGTNAGGSEATRPIVTGIENLRREFKL